MSKDNVFLTIMCIAVIVFGIFVAHENGLFAAQLAGVSSGNIVPSIKLPQRFLPDQLLQPNADWLTYYDTTPKDTVQIYYNLSVYLAVLREHTQQISKLQTRIESLEKLSQNVSLPIEPNLPKVIGEDIGQFEKKGGD